MKPVLYVANISEEDIGKENEYVKQVREYAKKENSEVISLCVKIEEELSALEGEEKKRNARSHGA